MLSHFQRSTKAGLPLPAGRRCPAAAGYFCKEIEIGLLPGCFQAFSQELYHVKGYCIFHHIQVDGVVQISQFVFGNALKVFDFRCDIPPVPGYYPAAAGFLGSFGFGRTGAVYHIRLYPEEFSKYTHDQAGVAILYRARNTMPRVLEAIFSGFVVSI